MAETKPKGAPVFLEIPTTKEKITLPGVTSLNNQDELKAAADAWLVKNYKGPTLAAPIIIRPPVAGKMQDVTIALPFAPPKTVDSVSVMAPVQVVPATAGVAQVTDEDRVAQREMQAVYDAGIRDGKTPDQILQEVADIGVKYKRQVDPNYLDLVRAAAAKRGPMQFIPTQTGETGAVEGLLGDVLKTDLGQMAAGYFGGAANAITAGYGMDPETKDYLRETAPVSSFVGELTGGALATVPAIRGAQIGLAGTRLAGAAPLIGEAAYGALYGSGEAGEGNRLLGATVGGVGGLAGGALLNRFVPGGPGTFTGAPKATLTPEMAAVAAPVPPVPPTRMPEEQGMAGIKALGEKGQTRPIATQEVTDKVLRFETDYLKETGLSRPERLPLKDFFFMHFDAGTLPMDRTLELAKQAGIDPSDLTDFVAGSQQTATEAARILRARMVMSKYIPKEAADVAEAGVKTPDELSLWKRTTDATRGLMVSQLATTMRNTWGSVVRLPIDMATSLTSTAINAAMNPFRNDKVGTSALDAFAVITDRFQPARNKQFYEQLRTYYPKTVKDLNATYAADVAGGVAKDKFGKVEKVVNTLNLVNRVTETTTRNMMFPVYLRRELTRRGMNIDDIVGTQRLDEIPQDAIDAALRETMDFTYGAAPKTDHIMGKVADKFIGLVEALGPAGVTVAPFPRFMVSALRFQAEYNPFGVMRLASKKNRDAMMAGDPEVLSKAIVGTGLFGAAYLFRSSDAAGEKWSEAKLPDGRVIDMKAYFPVPQYLLVADIIKRYNDGKLNGQTLDQAIDAKEIFQAVTGSQFRAGTGLYVVDEFIKDLTDAGSDPKKYLDIVGKFAADYGSAIFTPMQGLKDFYAAYDPEEAIYRDTKGSFLGTLTRSIPGAQRALDIPEAESPTREGPMTTTNPALRQLLGVTIRPAKNPVESELDRLGIAPYKMGSNTGDADTDRLVNRELGIIAERGIAPMLQLPEYQSLDNVGKSAAIKELYAKARQAANAKFDEENPELGLLKKVKAANREEEIMINRQVKASTGMSAPELLRQLSKAPLMKSQEQFDALPNGAQYTDPGDYKVYTKGK